jgi:hypothetical protein
MREDGEIILGSMTRKIQRAKARAEQKRAHGAMQKAFKTFDGMPKECGECAAIFDRTAPDALDQWRLAVYDDGRVHLVCPKCGPTPEELEAVGVE